MLSVREMAVNVAEPALPWWNLLCCRIICSDLGLGYYYVVEKLMTHFCIEMSCYDLSDNPVSPLSWLAYYLVAIKSLLWESRPGYFLWFL